MARAKRPTYFKEKSFMAIDFGSNAMRAIYGVLDAAGDLEILANYRFPIRLGEDVFSKGSISKHKMSKTHAAFKKLQLIIEKNEISKVYAMGTSALRNARNGKELIDSIYRNHNIKIQIISGKREAKLISQAIFYHMNLTEKTTLMLDIGGGSTEITLCKNKKIIYSKSFSYGTLRLLLLDSQEEMNNAANKFSQKVLSDLKNLGYHRNIAICVGTGGNLRRMGKLRNIFFQRSPKKIFQTELSGISSTIKSMTLKERVDLLSMRKDRADVIIPAICLVEDLLITLNLPSIYLPSLGLKEGIILNMINPPPVNILT